VRGLDSSHGTRGVCTRCRRGISAHMVRARAARTHAAGTHAACTHVACTLRMHIQGGWHGRGGAGAAQDVLLGAHKGGAHELRVRHVQAPGGWHAQGAKHGVRSMVCASWPFLGGERGGGAPGRPCARTHQQTHTPTHAHTATTRVAVANTGTARCACVCAVHARARQAINWLIGLADPAGGGAGRGFKQSGFETFERIWTGQQVWRACVCEPVRRCLPARGCRLTPARA
jgi:hypothetical protein